MRCIQRDPDTSEKWARVSLIRFNKAMHLGQSNPQYQHRLEDEGIESSQVEKDVKQMVNEKLDISQNRPESQLALPTEAWPAE